MTDASLAIQRFAQSELLPLEGPGAAPPLSRPAAAALLGIHRLLVDAARRVREARLAGAVKERVVELDLADSRYAGVGRFYASVPIDARRSVDSRIERGHVSSMSVRGRAVSLTVMFPDSAGEAADAAEARAMADRVFAWLDAAAAFAPEKCARTLAVFVILSGAAKQLPAPEPAPPRKAAGGGREIRERHVNSGLTVSCARDGDIYVYRREEWFKVFVHETIHSLGVDFSAMSAADTGAINACVKKTFSLKKPDLRVFEAYCEAWAEIINAVAYVLARPGRPSGGALAAIERQMAVERRWSAFQCAKIMHFYGIAYEHLFSVDAGVVAARDAAYRETDTYTFSYYAAKMVLLCNLGAFLDWCVGHNATVVGFRNDLATGLAFCALLRELRDAPGMLRVVRANSSRLRTRVWTDSIGKKLLGKGVSMGSTLRMAATEF